MNNIITNFMENDYGVGGVSNYTPEQVESLRNVLASLFNGDMACAEISSIRDFLISLNTDTESQPLIDCINEMGGDEPLN